MLCYMCVISVKTGNRVITVFWSHYHYHIIRLPLQLYKAVLWLQSVYSNQTLFLFSVIRRHTSASSECLSREREACCNYWEITLRPNTSFAAQSSPHMHPHTHSKHSTLSHNNSNTLMHTNTKSIQTGSRLQHLLHPQPTQRTLSQPENWQEPVGALCSIQPNPSHEQRHEAPHLRDLWLQTCSCQ